MKKGKANSVSKGDKKNPLEFHAERYRRICERMGDMVSVLSYDSTFLHASESHRKALGYKPSDLVGKKALSLVHSDDRKRLVSILGKYLKKMGKGALSGQNVTETVEYRIMDAKGKPRWIESKGSLLAWNEILCVSRDITRRKQADEAILATTDEIRLQAKQNLLRAKIWEIAARKPLSEESLTKELLNAVGPELGFARACYNRIRENKLVCEMEWCAKGVKPSIGTSLPSLFAKHFLGRKSREITVEGALSLLPTSFRKAARPVVTAFAKALDLEAVYAFPYYVGRRLEGVFTFDVVKGQADNPRLGKEEKSIISEIVKITSLCMTQVRMETALQDSKRDLEERVRERTLALEMSNQRLQASEEQFRELAEETPNMIFINFEGRIAYANHMCEKVTGYSRKELCSPSFSFLSLIAPESMEKVKRNYASHQKGHEVPPVDLVLVKRKKEKVDAILATKLVNYRGGKAILGVMTDITQRKKNEREIMLAKDRAEKASTAKSDFLSRMSHELRTPLTSVLGYADLLQAKGDRLDSQNAMESLKTITRNARHLLDMINDLLDLRGIETGKISISAAPVDLGKLLQQVHQTMSPLVRNRAVSLELELPRSVPIIKTDPDRLKQVLVNIVGNAVKFTSRGKITVALTKSKQKEEAARVSIADTGEGIPEDQLPMIFDEFYQGQPNSQSGKTGVGIGLTISKQITESLGGRIEAKSKEGKGSTFTVVLPKRCR